MGSQRQAATAPNQGSSGVGPEQARVSAPTAYQEASGLVERQFALVENKPEAFRYR